MLHSLPVFFLIGLALTLVAILVERRFWHSTWVQSTIQGGRDLCLFSMGWMFSLILSTPSRGGAAHSMGYLYMAGTASLLVLTTLLRRSSWQPWTIAGWSVGLGLVAISVPALWWEH